MLAHFDVHSRELFRFELHILRKLINGNVLNRDSQCQHLAHCTANYSEKFGPIQPKGLVPSLVRALGTPVHVGTLLVFKMHFVLPLILR